MSDFNPEPTVLPDFPDRPDGYDSVDIHIRAFRPDPEDDSMAGDLGVAIAESGFPEALFTALAAVGVDPADVYAQATFIDHETAPVVRLVDVYPLAAPAPDPEPTPDPEPEG